jgi:pimeloyl-ACP methyl ester carboxylesterase
MPARHCFAICALISALLSPVAAIAQTSAGSPELLGKNLVDIGGGRRMNIVCIGQGSPTIVFDYGMGEHILVWQKVQAPVSAITKACFYDRAGYGFSDPSDGPMTADNVTDDLHALLHAAGITGPLVLVGHSLGGLYATLYTDKFPSQVAGLVLIDPSFAGQEPAAWGADEKQRIKPEFERLLTNTKACADLARAGKLSQSDSHGCFQLAPVRTPAETAYLMQSFLKPFRYESAISEAESHSALATGRNEDSLEEERAARPFGVRPVIVLTGSVYPPDPYETPAMEKAFYDNWKAGHDRLAARSTGGQSIVVSQAGHSIQLDQPQQVIAAMRTVIFEVRKSQSD